MAAGAFDTLIGLFDRVGIQKNFMKTVGMICHPFRAVGTQSDAACEWRMTTEGLSYW